jgi:superfamily I DNA/RNA helicase
MENTFEIEYALLNTAQREAVDTTEGPVMVIAGPGTGKTQILAIRIGKILLATDTKPENILCMTYTDSGAIAAALDVMFVVQSIERIGDHAKNLAEYVIHIVEGIDTRHTRSVANGAP